MSRLTLLHTNDMHGTSSALEWLARYAPDDALLLDAGDAIAGSNTAFRRTEPNLVKMSELGYQVMTMGNREFHYLRGVLKSRDRQRNFPVLAANLVDLRGRSQGLWEPYRILDKNGLRIGVLGATVVQYEVGSLWEKIFGFRFLSPATCLPPLVRELREQCDLVIFLSHLGLDCDRELAPSLAGVDIILGGHTHERLHQPEKIDGCWIFQAGSHGRCVGEISLRLKPNLEVDYSLRECRSV